MKTSLTIILLFLLLFPLSRLSAQSVQNNNTGLPIKPANVLFGKDIIIHDQPDRNQRNIAVCSAFNGWLYAVYSYNNGNQPYIAVIRSTDNGITWNLLGEGNSFFAGYLITKLDIIACGNSLSTLKIFIAEAVTDTAVFPKWGGIFVGRYQGDPFVGEAQILGDGGYMAGWYHDIALTSDQNFPVNNSNPFSIAVAYAKTGDGNKDTIFFYSSSNGGMSFDNKKIVALSDRNLEKVALSFGRSASKPGGRYFVTWEEKNPGNAATGHIYTAHSEPDFNSAFTKPVCLDSLDPAAINKVRNPAIACQFSSSDNDSSNLSEVIMLEKQLSPNNYDTRGFYNLQATTSNHFTEFALSSSSNNKTQPDLNFNPYNSTFMLTYYDSSLQSLPFLTKDVNLVNPDSWNIITNAYNDIGNLVSPNPKVELNFEQQEGMNVWISEATSGNGIAMFDAPYSTYTGISVNNIAGNGLNSRVYPNPCNQSVTISFELKRPEKVTIHLYNLVGQPIGLLLDQSYPSGKHKVNIDVSKLSPGSYLFTLKAGDFSGSGKINVIR